MMKTFFKQKTPRDKKFLKWLLTRPCELRPGNNVPAFCGPCSGEMIYHHTETGGMGLKGSDYSAISTCFGHHKLFDKATKKGIGIFSSERLAKIIARNQEEWGAQR